VVGIAALCGLVTPACSDRRARLGQHRSGLSASCDYGGCGYGSCDCGSGSDVDGKFAKTFVPLRIIDPTAIVTAVETAWQLSFKNRMPGTELGLLGQKWQIVTDPAPFKHIHISRSIAGQKPRKVDVDKDPKVCP
jgi:hypothetical protein